MKLSSLNQLTKTRIEKPIKVVFWKLTNSKGLPFRVAEKAVEYSLKINKMPDLGKSNEEYFEELYDLIDENVRPTSLIPIIDLKYFAKYNKKAGFKLSIDGFHNLKKD